MRYDRYRAAELLTYLADLVKLMRGSSSFFIEVRRVKHATRFVDSGCVTIQIEHIRAHWASTVYMIVLRTKFAMTTFQEFEDIYYV